MTMKIERNNLVGTLTRANRQALAKLPPIPEDRSVREMMDDSEEDYEETRTDTSSSSSSSSFSSRVWKNNAKPIRAVRLSRDESLKLVSFYFDMINEERTIVHGLQPFLRDAYLDDMAQQHTDYMAQSKGHAVKHAVNSIHELRDMLGSQHVASNVQRGDSLVDMHTAAMTQHDVNKRNLLSTLFTQFGMGVSMDQNNKLYICQYFRG